MPKDIERLLSAPVWRAFDVDDQGRILAGTDDSGSIQLVEIEPGGGRTPLTALPGACSGRYLPGRRMVVVEHDQGGDEMHQLSMMALDPIPDAPLLLEGLTPLAHDPQFFHNLLTVGPDWVAYSCNRRNSVDFDLLVATSVIEVGVDVPNATVIGIEGADRFGLAQLHQFRGRVGRGAHQSHCLLFTEDDDPSGRARLRALIEHQDGFELAEIDLRLRGSGDPYGLRQHGFPEMRVGDLLDDGLRERARAAAERVLARDPGLKDPTLRNGIRGYQVVFEFD